MSIGPYVLVKIFGEGRMGQVWLAEQAAPVKQPVAVSVLGLRSHTDYVPSCVQYRPKGRNARMIGSVVL